jgi:hypothetical protein
MIQNTDKDGHLPLLFSLAIITVLHDTDEKIDPIARPTISYQHDSNNQQTHTLGTPNIPKLSPSRTAP